MVETDDDCLLLNKIDILRFKEEEKRTVSARTSDSINNLEMLAASACKMPIDK